MSITQIYEIFKGAFAAANTLTNAEHKSKILDSLVSVQEAALALQEENGKLAERIRELEEQIKSHDRFDKEMKYYDRVEVNKCIIYQHKEDGFYACPHCIIENRKIFPLQRYSAISYSCPSCKYPYQLIPTGPVGKANMRGWT